MFSGKIYTTGKVFTRPPVATNKSDYEGPFFSVQDPNIAKGPTDLRIEWNAMAIERVATECYISTFREQRFIAKRCATTKYQRQGHINQVY